MAPRPSPALSVQSSDSPRVGPFGPLLLAAAVPLLFLHVRFQPSFDLGFAGAEVTTADLVVLLVVAAALAAGLRDGFEPLRLGLPIYLGIAALLAVVLAATFWPLAQDDPYPWRTHLVTALKFGEYALLAPAVPLLVRDARGARPLLAAVVGWSIPMTLVAALQFLGVVSTWDSTPAGRRKPSLLGYHDFAALSGAALAVGLVGIALGGSRRWTWTAVATGTLGLVLSGAVSALLGIGVAALALVVAVGRRLTRTRLLALAGVVLVTAAGTLAIRGSALSDFARFLGADTEHGQQGVESYAHRTLLGYIGLKIFLDRPLLGAGWQGSAEKYAYGPVLDDAHRRFPSEPALAFPSEEHPWGVQNAFVQALADLGVLGLPLFLAPFGAALWIGLVRARRSRAALVGVTWALVALGVWNGIGLVAGLPLDALTWLALGLAAVRE